MGLMECEEVPDYTSVVWYNRKKKKENTKFSNSERKTVLLAGFFPGDIRYKGYGG